MYSIVLVMALAGSAEVPDCHNSHGCCGIGVSCGCYGASYGGCYGGCYGGSYGCSGYVRSGCYGSVGCYGSYGCSGYGVGMGGYGYSGCTGYMGSVGCYGGGYVVQPGAPAMMPKGDMPKGEVVPAPTTPKSARVPQPAPATIVVTLPANAKLSIDGYVSQQTSGERRLVTPAIQPGQEFTYTLVATSTQEGQPVSQTQRVSVRGGQVLPVNLTPSTLPTSASR